MCKTGRLCVKSFSPAVGGGRWENFFKDRGVFSIKEFFSFRGGISEVGGWWRDKKIFSGKNFRSRFGGVQQRSGYIQRSKFLASEYITFQGGQMCPRSVCWDLLIM